MALKSQFVVAILLCVSHVVKSEGEVAPPSEDKLVTGNFQVKISGKKDNYNINIGLTECGSGITKSPTTETPKLKCVRVHSVPLKGDPGVDSIAAASCSCTNGTKGEPGEPGPKGEPGPPGVVPREGLGKEAPARPTLGSLENPANSCTDVDTSGNHYINPSKPMEVKCNTEMKATCVIVKELDEAAQKALVVNFTTTNFWLSHYGFDIHKFYGIDVTQIKYLLDKSIEVRQIIRYHCMNTEVNRDEKTSLQILSWSDRLMDNKPTSEMPIHYSVVDDTCKGAEATGWKYADVQLTSKSNTRLPVIDFYIRDIKGTSLQQVRLELRELCFTHEYED